MKVILTQDVPRLGKAHEVIDVAEGYGRNFLLPRHLAEEATPGALRRLSEEKREHDRHARHEEAEAQALVQTLQSAPVRIGVKVGEGGRTFGSVTTKDIAQAVKSAFRVDVDKRHFELDQPIRTPGTYTVEVRVHPKYRATVTVVVEEAKG